jgi:hypothetical protein
MMDKDNGGQNRYTMKYANTQSNKLSLLSWGKLVHTGTKSGLYTPMTALVGRLDVCMEKTGLGGVSYDSQGNFSPGMMYGNI